MIAWAMRWWRFARAPARGLGASDHATSQRRARGRPAPGAGQTPAPGAKAPLALPPAAESPPRQPPAPGHHRARPSYRAPAAGENHGPCHTTIHLHEGGIAVVLDHRRKRRLVFKPPTAADSDAEFFARIEREVFGPPDTPCPDCAAPVGRSCHAGCPRLAGDPDGR